MTLFVDASALISIIAAEDDAGALEDRLMKDAKRYMSAVSIWESVAGLRHSYSFAISDGRTLVERYLTAGDFEVVAIDRTIADLAIEALQTYGKGRHPASLNMGDCFAYACAKALKAGLLYKGEDFKQTDLR